MSVDERTKRLLEVAREARELLKPEVAKEPERTIFWRLVKAIASFDIESQPDVKARGEYYLHKTSKTYREPEEFEQLVNSIRGEGAQKRLRMMYTRVREILEGES